MILGPRALKNSTQRLTVVGGSKEQILCDWYFIFQVLYLSTLYVGKTCLVYVLNT